MTYSLQWLPSVIHAAGLTVVETQGWQTRGHGDVAKIRGVMCHHTAGRPKAEMDLPILIKGRPDLAGPLCQLGLGRSGKVYIICAGLGYHAGAGLWQDLRSGNSSFIGIEAENTGLKSDPWPQVQMDAYATLVAALLKHVGSSAKMCCGHKEYALPHGRKDDPSFDMNLFRAEVTRLMVAA